MTRKDLTLLAMSFGAALAAACGAHVDLPPGLGGDAGGTCPCTVGNSGISFTLPCGASQCFDLNGTATGYTCNETGTHIDQAVCSSPRDAGSRPDGTTRHDAGPLDAGSPDAHPPTDAASDHPVLPDGTLFPDGAVCVPTTEGGTCNAAGCSCPPVEGCSFACNDEGADAGAVLNCNPVETCNATCGGGCEVDCIQSGGCTVEAGAGSQVHCVQAQSCNSSLGADASVDCTQATVCSATVASGGSVECLQAQTCDVTCTGSCTVDCTQAENCRVNCAPSAECNVTCSPSSQTTCPDGTLVCGLLSPTCPPSDAGPG
jgi:hypothetical protein